VDFSACFLELAQNWALRAAADGLPWHADIPAPKAAPDSGPCPCHSFDIVHQLLTGSWGRRILHHCTGRCMSRPCQLPQLSQSFLYLFKVVARSSSGSATSCSVCNNSLKPVLRAMSSARVPARARPQPSLRARTHPRQSQPSVTAAEPPRPRPPAAAEPPRPRPPAAAEPPRPRPRPRPRTVRAARGALGTGGRPARLWRGRAWASCLITRSMFWTCTAAGRKRE
jgi:hypothetical protein